MLINYTTIALFYQKTIYYIDLFSDFMLQLPKIRTRPLRKHHPQAAFRGSHAGSVLLNGFRVLSKLRAYSDPSSGARQCA
jgi:hypothetical protein